MAYFVVVKGTNVRFPPVCAACCGPGPLFAAEQSITQASGFYVVAYTTRTSTVAYPICSRCRSAAKRRMILVVSMMFGPWAALFLSFAFIGDVEARAEFAASAFPFALLVSLASIPVGLWKGRREVNLDLIHASRTETAFRSNSRAYADELARCNGVTVEEKTVFVRVV